MAAVTSHYTLFVELVRQVYRTVGSEVPEFNLAPGVPLAFDLTIDGVACVVGYNPLLSTEKLRVFCRFGAVPEDQAATVLYRLLELNLVLMQSAATLGVDPESRDVIYAFDALMEEINASSLLNALTMAAGQAKRWRQTYFLDDDGLQRPPDPTSFMSFA